MQNYGPLLTSLFVVLHSLFNCDELKSKCYPSHKVEPLRRIIVPVEVTHVTDVVEIEEGGEQFSIAIL
jgi:hypothetical protein